MRLAVGGFSVSATFLVMGSCFPEYQTPNQIGRSLLKIFPYCRGLARSIHQRPSSYSLAATPDWYSILSDIEGTISPCNNGRGLWCKFPSYCSSNNPCLTQSLILSVLQTVSRISEFYVRTKGFSMSAASTCLAPAAIGGTVSGVLAGKRIQK